jgi:hypothetical protein
MNNIIIALVSFYCTLFCNQTEFISINNVGKHDVLIPTIIISTSVIESKFVNNYVVKHKFMVNCEVYEKLREIIILNKPNNLPSECNEYGCFEVVLHDQDKLLLDYSTHRKESIRLFAQLIDILQKELSNKDLLSEFEKIKKQININ